MSTGDEECARKLIASFAQFSRLPWDKAPSRLRPRKVILLNTIKKMAAETGSGVKVTELSGALEVTAPTITQFANEMVLEGLVRRYEDPEDRRAVRLELTDKGEMILREAVAYFIPAFAGLVEFLGNEDSLRLAYLMDRVAEYFRASNR